MLPRSGLRLRRKTSSCCCPAHSPRTHSLFTCRGQHKGEQDKYAGKHFLPQGGESIMEINLNSERNSREKLTLMTLKLRNLLLSMMILYSSLPSSMMWRSARSEGMFAKIALRHTGSPSWDISIFSSLAVMASYRTIGSSYSSGDVKWSWRKMQIKGWSLLTKQHVIQPSEWVFFFWVKCYLMKFEGHPYSWSNNSIQQVHICEHPLISRRCDAKITLEERMETIQKWLQAVEDTYQSTTFIYDKDRV